MQLLKDSLLVLGLALGFLVSVELILWAFAPQQPERTFGPQGTFAILDSLLTYRLRPNATLHEKTVEFEVTYQTDSAGFRVHPAEPDPALTVLVLGDSFTFGVGVEADQTWPVHLQELLGEAGISAQVINAGIIGYDTLNQLQLAQELLPRYKPDLVLVGLLVNDVMTNRERSAGPLTGTPPRFNWSPAQLHLVPFTKRILLSSDWLYAKLYLSTSRGDFFQVSPPAHVQKQIEITASLLADLSSDARAHGAQFGIVSIPQQIQLIGAQHGLSSSVDVAIVTRSLVNHDTLRNVLWIKTLDALAEVARQSDEPLYFRLDGHLTAHGSRAVGTEVARSLTRDLPLVTSLLPEQP